MSSRVATSSAPSATAPRPQVRRQVVVVALEAVAGDAQARGENVQLVEARVADKMAPVRERKPRLRVRAQLVDEDCLPRERRGARRGRRAAASIWRPLAPSQDAIAADGLKFLRALLG